MPDKIDKARKYLALWAEDADRLKQLSQQTGRTQVELLHEAIGNLARYLVTKKEQSHAR
jgi:predicted DNA-binding protein